jgi:hypothetical protein
VAGVVIVKLGLGREVLAALFAAEDLGPRASLDATGVGLQADRRAAVLTLEVLVQPKLEKKSTKKFVDISFFAAKLSYIILHTGAYFLYIFFRVKFLGKSAEKFPPKNVGKNWNFPRKIFRKIIFPRN